MRLVRFILVPLLIALGIYVFGASLDPDPFLYGPESSLLAKGMVWLVRGIAIIFVLCGSLMAISALAFQRSLAILLASIFAIWLASPLVSYVYYSRQAFDTSDFNPYLQLNPPPLPEILDDHAVKIVCLGGSTTAWSDSAGSGWPEHLEQNLNKNGQTKYLVINQGKEWYTSLHSLYNYVSRVRSVRPDIIVVMQAINDLLHNADFSYFSKGPFATDYSHFMGPLSRLLKPPTLEGVIADKSRGILNFEGREAINIDTFPGEESYRRNLNSLVEIAQRDGSKVILMTEPTLLKESMSTEEERMLYMVNKEAIGPTKRWTATTAWRGMERYNQILREVAKSQDVLLVDLEQRIPKSKQYFIDDVHYTDETHPMIAEEIAPIVLAVLAKKKT